MNRLMISVSGVRGVVGGGLTPEIITAYAAAFGTYCSGGEIILGRDTRTSGEMVRHAALAGLLAVGCNVRDVGIAPTPTIQFAVEKSGAQGGIAITASHNPAEWNALKFFASDGLFLDEEQSAKLKSIRDQWRENYVSWQKIGKVEEYPNAIDQHIFAILNCPLFDLASIRKRSFKVAVDTVCGAGGVMIPQLLAELGCSVVKINKELTGCFPHNPEPLPENITELCRYVKSEACDVGFAVDPDADRLAIVSENGQPIGEENTLVLAARLVLKHQRGPVVANVSTTRALEDIAGAADVPVHRSKVGEIHVVRKMQEVNAVIGGEGNGGVIFPAVHLARDSAVGILMTLQTMVEANQPLSRVMHSLPQYFITKRKMPVGDSNPEEVLAALSEQFRRERQDRIDGLKIIKPEGWFQVRASNTEPILRIYAEGINPQTAEALADEAVRAIRRITPNIGGRE